MKRWITAFFLSYLAVGVPQADATDRPMIPHIQVSGEHSVKLAPDIAYLDVVAYAESLELEQAKRQADDRLRQVKLVAQESGIASQDVKVDQVSITPRYNYLEQGKRELAGYEVSYQVMMTLRKPDKAGDILQKLTAAGIDRVNQVRFALEHPEKARQEALMQALKNARLKAEMLANTAGGQLGKPLAIQEGASHYQPPVMPMFKAMAVESAAADMAGGEALPTGEMDIGAQVTVIYELQ